MDRLVVNSEDEPAECRIIELLWPPLPLPCEPDASPRHCQLLEVDSAAPVALYKLDCRLTMTRGNETLAIVGSGDEA